MTVGVGKSVTTSDRNKRFPGKAAFTLLLIVAVAASSTILSRRSVMLFVPHVSLYEASNSSENIQNESGDTIAPNSSPNNGLLALSPPQSEFAYAFIMFLCDPTDARKKYRQYMSNIMVGAKIFRDKVHSRADIVILIKTKYESNATRLLPEDEEMLRKLNVRTVYLPFVPDFPGIYMGTMNKFYAWNLTEYRRVLLLDADVMPMASMDYMFDLSMQGVIEPHVVMSGLLEPANAGWALLEPTTHHFNRLQEYITEMPLPKRFDRLNGWGHRIEEPDFWETNEIGKNGTRWDYHGAAIDQGLLYHYPKYELKHMTSIFSRKVETFGPDPSNSSKVKVIRRWDVKDRESSPFGNLSKPFWPILPMNCVRLSGGAPCVPPYTDFHHFVGGRSPWSLPFSLNIWNGIQNPTLSYHIWWKVLLELQVEDDIDILSLGLNFSGIDPRTANASSFEQSALNGNQNKKEMSLGSNQSVTSASG